MRPTRNEVVEGVGMFFVALYAFYTVCAFLIVFHDFAAPLFSSPNFLRPEDGCFGICMSLEKYFQKKCYNFGHKGTTWSETHTKEPKTP